MSLNPKPPTPRSWRELRQKEAQEILDHLPEVAAAEFTLTWDIEVTGAQRHWIVRHGEEVIYREPARYEDYHRFELLARLLRQKYGHRIRDLVPAENNDVACYLYGDFLGAVSRIESARKRNFGA